MSFTDRAKLTALAIVHIFETGKPLGQYDAVAVLNDGAGISYGVNQFTHRSGSLAAVLDRFVRLGGILPYSVELALIDLRAKRNIDMHSADSLLKAELAGLGKDQLMQQAQREISFENYLRPAIIAAEGSDFIYPLSLAVIFDSINHGSYASIRDRVNLNLPPSIKPEEWEREWITQYVRLRHGWLRSIPRLAVTSYRTKFFLDQIVVANWNLKLPVTVHGRKLTESDIGASTANIRPQVEKPLSETPSASITESETPLVPQSPTENAPAEDQPADEISGQLPVAGGQPADDSSKTIDAPPPTGFMHKLKTQFWALAAFIGGGAGLKEWLGVQLTSETVEILKILLPTVLGLGFIGFLVWFVTEKIIGFKTLRLKAEAPQDLKIRPQ